MSRPLTLTATDAQSATVEQSIRVEVSDSELKKVANTALSSFSRAVLNSVSSTIGARLMADADGLYTPFTTYSLDDFAPSGDFAQPVDGFSNASPFADAQMPWSQASSPNSLGYAQNGAYDLASMFGRGFALKLAAAGDPMFWSIWGRRRPANLRRSRPRRQRQLVLLWWRHDLARPMDLRSRDR